MAIIRVTYRLGFCIKGLEAMLMARPIEVTPVLKGKDAQAFLRETRDVQVTTERLSWLASVAQESRQAETKK